ncbi:hypothetical protein G2W53_041549 [Senna tora]|uniref:Uncharacterized protein n=1 Tax=Senna tora TaxID=362788 RepID=A0A834SHL3_9FABA|nr:hypothetical protein G2W53_041549 [Senna tora]
MHRPLTDNPSCEDALSEISNQASISRVFSERSHKATRTGSPEEDTWNAENVGRLDRKSHASIGNNTSNGRDKASGSRSFEASHELEKRSKAGVASGIAERRDVLGGIGIGGREAVRDGYVAKVRKAMEGVGTLGSEEAFVVELGVDKGDVEAFGLKDFG